MPQPPVAVALRFIDCVNRCDLDGLTSVMTDDHRLKVFDEDPLVGKAANAQAWRGYFSGFPEYVIYPHKLASVTDATSRFLATPRGHTSDCPIAKNPARR